MWIVAESFAGEHIRGPASARAGAGLCQSGLKIWVAAQPTDFRKSIHTLSAALKANSYGGAERN